MNNIQTSLNFNSFFILEFFLEWIVCPIVFLLTPLFDKRNIDISETVNEGDVSNAKI
jgi:hypothetical protein